MSSSLKRKLEITVDGLPEKVRASLPYPEPEKPKQGWRYPVSKPYISLKAVEYVQEAIKDGLISSATKPVKTFEDKLKSLFQVPVAKACSSGYSALLLCMKAAEVGPGDNVIVPALTMIAVANAVIDVGATPIVVDVAPDQYNPSPEQYGDKVTPKTKAIVVCHTYGIPVDLYPIRQLCDERCIALIEDIAEATGSTYQGQLVGQIGDFAAASLYANKLITSGDGGFVLSTRETTSDGVSMYEQLRSFTNHGFVPDYHFMHLYQSGNYKMSGLEAAFVTPAIDDVKKVAEKRTEIAAWYRKFLADVPGIRLMPKSQFGPETPWVFGIEVETKEKRRAMRKILAENEIETRDYFLPLHLQPPLQGKLDCAEPPDLPNAQHLGKVGFYLPTYHHLQESDVEFICDVIKRKH